MCLGRAPCEFWETSGSVRLQMSRYQLLVTIYDQKEFLDLHVELPFCRVAQTQYKKDALSLEMRHARKVQD